MNLKDINLLPNDLKKGSLKGQDSRKQTDFRDKMDPKKLWIGLIVVFLLVVTFLFPILYNNILKQNVKKVNDEIKGESFDIVREVNAKLDEVEGVLDNKRGIIGTIDQTTVPISEILVAIPSIMPSDTILNGFSLTGKIVTINGVVSKYIQLGEIITRAKRSNYFDVEKNVPISFNEKNNFNLEFKLVE